MRKKKLENKRAVIEVDKSDLSNRGFFDYVTGKLPESYKQLQAQNEGE